MAVSARKRHPVRALVRFHTGAFRADALYVADRRERNAALPLERAVIERARRSHDEFVFLAALRRLRRDRAGGGAERRGIRTHRDCAGHARSPRVRAGVRRSAHGDRPRRERRHGRSRCGIARGRAPGAASARTQPFFRMIRTASTMLVFVIFTIICGLMGLTGALLNLRDGVGSVFDYAMRLWGTTAAWASGMKVVVHGRENLEGAQHIIVSNHMSQHDIFVLASVLKNLKFVAKNELARVPFFGRAAASVGTIYIERQNRKSSFDSYRQAAEKIRTGACVVVFAEGSRGATYSLRPFKKGPFVLAVHVHAPIVPVVIHGTREVHPKGTIRVTAGKVDVHFLEPIQTEGLTYDDRNALAKTVYDRMAALLVAEYGVESPDWDPRRTSLAR